MQPAITSSRPIRRLAAAAALLVATTGSAAIATAQEVAPPATGGPVGVFPAAGTRSASPRTEISFRGVAPGALGTISVEGSRSGGRAGSVRPHPDGNGVSLVFATPFRSGERVTVRTELDVAGAQAGNFSFTTVGRAREGLGSGSPPPRSLLRQYTAQRGRVPRGAVPRYRSRPDLRPPEIQVSTRTRAGVAEGSMFVSPKKVFGARRRPGLQSGPLILDNRAEPVWFAPLSDGNVSDFRVQRYRGRPVLTWWQGRQVLGSGEGVVQIVDSAYRSVRRVRAGNDYSFDFHEALVTEQGTLLGLVYSPVDLDLRSVGGPRDGRVVDGIVQEVDIATGRVLFEWHSLGNVDLQESYGPVPRKRRGLYDYFHVNAIGIDTDGNLLVSGRETWSVLKLDRRTGATIWRLGGKRSDFRLPRSGRFAWQHDAQRAPDGTIRIFDNEAAPKVRSKSRVLWLALDEERRTARVARSAEHPAGLLSGTQGNAQALPNGNTFVGWGSQGYFTEYGAGGRVLFDARVARGNDTYRAYRFPWSGTPGGRPALAAERRGSGRTAVWASWNGATQVAGWQVLAGDRPEALEPVVSMTRSGFETAYLVRTAARYVAVRALDATGQVLGTSRAERVARAAR